MASNRHRPAFYDAPNTHHLSAFPHVVTLHPPTLLLCTRPRCYSAPAHAVPTSQHPSLQHWSKAHTANTHTHKHTHQCPPRPSAALHSPPLSPQGPTDPHPPPHARPTATAQPLSSLPAHLEPAKVLRATHPAVLPAAAIACCCHFALHSPSWRWMAYRASVWLIGCWAA